MSFVGLSKAKASLGKNIQYSLIACFPGFSLSETLSGAVNLQFPSVPTTSDLQYLLAMQFQLAIIRSVDLKEIKCIAETNKSLFLDLIQLVYNVQPSLALSLTP